MEQWNLQPDFIYNPKLQKQAIFSMKIQVFNAPLVSLV